MDEKKPHWFIEFARQTNLYIAITSFLFALWLVRFGVDNIKHNALLEYFGEEEARNREASLEISKKIPFLFDAKFYRMDEENQLREADRFWNTHIAPIVSNLPPERIAESRELLFSSIYRMNHPINEGTINLLERADIDDKKREKDAAIAEVDDMHLLKQWDYEAENSNKIQNQLYKESQELQEEVIKAISQGKTADEFAKESHSNTSPQEQPEKK